MYAFARCCGLDPESIDSDGDGLTDGEEDENQDGKIEGDSGLGDNTWGFWDEWEDWKETDPNDYDTDDDLLWDGPDIGENYGEMTIHKVGTKLIISGKVIFDYTFDQNSTTNPLINDSDSDGITDYLELQGWPCAVFKGSTGFCLKNDTVFPDPSLSDYDGDGVLDGEEFSNCSNPFELDTDEDYLLDFFDDNLIVTETEKPGIHYYSHEANPDWGVWNIKIKFEAHDCFGISQIRVKLSTYSQDETDIVNIDDFQSVVKYDHTFEIKWDGALTIGDGVNIHIMVWDNSGNFEEKVKGIKSIMGIVQDSVEQIVKRMRNWVLDKYSQMLKPVVNDIALIKSESEDLPKIMKKTYKFFIAQLFVSIFASSNIVSMDNILTIFSDLSEQQKTNIYCVIGIIIILAVSVMAMLIVKDLNIVYLIGLFASLAVGVLTSQIE